mgnify:CR=1 FL=1
MVQLNITRDIACHKNLCSEQEYLKMCPKSLSIEK